MKFARSRQEPTSPQRVATPVRPVAPPLVTDVLRSQGRPLDTSTQAEMAARFRFDFSTVRIHADPQAGESAKQVGASAYTVGQHVVFSAGRYDRETRNGGPLLAHELAHVVQQRARPSGSEHIAMLDAPATEAEANGAARLVTMNQHPSVTQFAAGAPVLQRQ